MSKSGDLLKLLLEISATFKYKDAPELSQGDIGVDKMAVMKLPWQKFRPKVRMGLKSVVPIKDLPAGEGFKIIDIDQESFEDTGYVVQHLKSGKIWRVHPSAINIIFRETGSKIKPTPRGTRTW